LNAELITGELTVGGLARSFALRLPRNASGGIPLVLVLHGNHPDATGLMMREWTTFDEQADAFGFAVAYPDGIGGCWADGRGVTTGIGGTRIVTWTVFGGGHTWPGAKPFPGAAQTGPQEFDAAEEICRFAESLLASAESRHL
jgi:poly(3-hydroxybutyrate) depolymerase